MLKKLLLAGAAFALATGTASAKDLKSIGVTLGSLGNPFFVAMTKGITDKAGSGVKVVTASAEYDLNKQGTQMDNFIASGVDLILLNAADPKAIAPAVKRAQAAGIPVEPVDTIGAGDAFMAGLLAGLLAQPPRAALDPATLDRVCLLANATGAITTTARGAIPSLPGREAVRAFLAERGLAAGLPAAGAGDGR